jgi:SAM-dependent methyltransferase
MTDDWHGAAPCRDADPYGDQDLVALYDEDNPGGADHDYYRALADDLDARTIVDLGCGTGLLTRTFVGQGRTVLGIDPSRTMLHWARRQPGAESVTWVLGDASELPTDETVDLIVCTGNAIMHLTAEAPADAARRAVRALRAGGMLAFESRNPARREWEQWTPEATLGERDIPLGRLREWLEVTEVRDGRVTFDAHNVLPDGRDRVYRSVLHFRSAEAFVNALREAGFAEVRVDGGWRSEPVTPDSRLLVIRAERG